MDPSAPHPDSPPRAKAFISYSRADAAFAISLCQELEARGIEVLRDVEDTLPGEEWWQRLQSLIAGADAIVFVLSQRSVESKTTTTHGTFAER
jgi:TIR domain